MSKPRCRKLEYTQATGSMPCLAMPAAMETVWPSAMPVSKNRSGKRRANRARPVPSAIAAVSAATRSSRSASRQSAAPTAAEKLSAPFFMAPVTGSKGPTPWYFSGSASAKEQPRPFWVITCSSTGTRMSRAQAMALSSAATSCPSMGPR